MAIQWFPGHMHLTRKAIAERIKDIDVVIEVLDARLPGSSANPLLAEMTGHRPTVKVLNKQDVADPVRTVAWLDWYNARPETRAVPLDASEVAPAKRLIEACHFLAPGRGGMAKPMRVLICGIPNVGKSTLINTLTDKRQAKTGDEAGITKLEQRITLADDFYLWDTPGMLWPRIIVPESGFNLAASGAMGRNAYDEELVALELLGRLQRHYAEALVQRYKLGLTSSEVAAMPDDELLEAIGRKRGAMMGGGRVNLQKTAELLLTDFRTGIMGRVTLESPEEFEAWLQAGQAEDAARQARKEARDLARGKRPKVAKPSERSTSAKPSKAAEPAAAVAPRKTAALPANQPEKTDKAAKAPSTPKPASAAKTARAPQPAAGKKPAAAVPLKKVGKPAGKAGAKPAPQRGRGPRR
jgi:ribosome biogenesis GTPase A